MTQDDFRPQLAAAILDEARFVRATLSGAQRGAENRWERLVIRPVQLKTGRHLQFSYFDDKQNIIKNYAGDELSEQVQTALALPFANFHVTLTDEEVQARVTKKGKPLVSRRAVKTEAVPDLAHDREKQTILPANQPDPYLQAVGIMTEDGRIKAGMHDKFKQINEFLRLIDDTHPLDHLKNDPVRVVDAGCGSGYLTFALYHYLTHTLSRETVMVGIDTNQKLLEKQAERAAELGYSGLEFVPSRIIDYQTETLPDIVIALHACDTATDEAIAQGVRWNSPLLFIAPCCHHDLQAQLHKAETPDAFTPVMRHGILSERMGDVLTDSFRALVLRIMGYQTDVVEFVPTEHTPRNLMIRAVKTTAPGDAKFLAEYRALKAFWGVTPHLEKLLGGVLAE